MHDEVGIAADRRGEMGIAPEREAEVALVHRAVNRLGLGPQDHLVDHVLVIFSLNVFQQLVEMPDAAGVMTSPIALKKVSYQEIGLASSNANQEIRLPAGNQIKSVLVRTDGTTTAGEPSTTVLNNAQLAAGVDVRFNVSGTQLRAKNNADFGAFTAGYYVLDLTSKGQAAVNLTDLWDVSGAAEPKLILDVVGGANVKLQAVVTEFILAGSPS